MLNTVTIIGRIGFDWFRVVLFFVVRDRSILRSILMSAEEILFDLNSPSTYREV